MNMSLILVQALRVLYTNVAFKTLLIIIALISIYSLLSFLWCPFLGTKLKDP